MPVKSQKIKGAISAAEFDAKFDSGEDVFDHLDLSAAVAVPPELDVTPTKVNVDFPAWIVGELDREADRIGIARQALIKVFIAERLAEINELRARSFVSSSR